MRLIVEFLPESAVIRLPLAYNSLVQDFIYSNLEKTVADWLHAKGTPFGKKQFRFFTFSRLLGKYHIDGKRIEFSGQVKIHIGSVHERLLQSLAAFRSPFSTSSTT